MRLKFFGQFPKKLFLNPIRQWFPNFDEKMSQQSLHDIENHSMNLCLGSQLTIISTLP